MKIRFSHSPKTGGSSVVKALRTVYKDTPHTHRPFIKKSIYDKKGYEFSFATVRHPYEKRMSTYNYFEVIHKNMSFDIFLKELKELGYCTRGARIWTIQQHYYVENNGHKVDDIIRLESFEEDWERVINGKIGLEIAPIHVNETKVKIITELTDSQKEIIYSVDQKDFEILNYKK